MDSIGGRLRGLWFLFFSLLSGQVSGAELGDSSDSFYGGARETEADGAFVVHFVGGEFFLEGFDEMRLGGVEGEMVLPAGEVEDEAGGKFVGDSFFGVGDRRLNGLSHLLEDIVSRFGLGGDVFVDGFEVGVGLGVTGDRDYIGRRQPCCGRQKL